MDDRNDLSYMANLYMALADKTRLKLLGLMSSGEICVNDLTGAIGESQPKISRHLAYLRNAGVVDTRRDGKWIHYKIRWPEDAGARLMLSSALNWLGSPDSTVSVESYSEKTYGEPDMTNSAHNELDDYLL